MFVTDHKYLPQAIIDIPGEKIFNGVAPLAPSTCLNFHFTLKIMTYIRTRDWDGGTHFLVELWLLWRMFGSYEVSRLVLHRVGPDNRINPKSKKRDWSRLQVFIFSSFIGSERTKGFLFILIFIATERNEEFVFTSFSEWSGFQIFFLRFQFLERSGLRIFRFCKILQRCGFRSHQIRRNRQIRTRWDFRIYPKICSQIECWSGADSGFIFFIIYRNGLEFGF